MRRLVATVLIAGCLAQTGCDRWFEKKGKSQAEAADKKVEAGDFRGAIKLYENALDGTPTTADIHYKLAIIYDDKLKSPLDAMHHFERYLEMAPTGRYAKEAKAFRKEGDLKVMTALSKGGFLSQEEAVRLKNENLSLRKTLTDLRAQKTMAPPAATVKGGVAVQKPVPPGARTHTVAKGDTLASISVRYYKSKVRAKDIQDANFYSLEGTAKIKPGQVLIIP